MRVIILRIHFLNNYLPTWSSALQENGANSLIEGSHAAGVLPRVGPLHCCRDGQGLAGAGVWQPDTRVTGTVQSLREVCWAAFLLAPQRGERHSRAGVWF